MRRTPIVVTCIAIFAVALSATQPAHAQQQSVWVPQGIEALQQSASSKTDFSFDHSMLVLASKLDPDNEDLRRVIAGVSGISVHRYRFAGSWRYDQAAVSSVGEEYRAAGWKQVVNKREKTVGRDVDGVGVTDLWVRMENNAISNFAILLASANEVNFVVVSGSISPLDISHLGGHFGIPKIEGGVTVPKAE
jgi:hypothetical protein